jgi:Uma2 family endonuclease
MCAQRSLAYRWLPDDTEESILGADWHQDAISSLRNGLRDVARARRWPWHVGDQLTLVAWHADGTIWRPKPDIMVHPHAGPTPRDEMSATADGLPALIIEVASPSTYLSDVNVSPPTAERREAKGYEYLAWPLPEYLVFDPTGAYLPGQVRAWRVVEGQVQEWPPDAITAASWVCPSAPRAFSCASLILRGTLSRWTTRRLTPSRGWSRRGPR